MISANTIVQAAKACGFDKCGIIPVSMMAGYEDKLEERIKHFPETRSKYQDFRSLLILK